MTSGSYSRPIPKGVPNPVDDSPPADAEDHTLSATKKIYAYDAPGIDLAPAFLLNEPVVGGYFRLERQFVWKIETSDDNGNSWVQAASMNVAQVLAVKRLASTGVTKTDWEGKANSISTGNVDVKIVESEVRALVGGTLQIQIDAHAND